MFVVFEGLDGSGKSTLMRSFKESLQSRQVKFEEVFDPGGTSVGDKVRQVLLSKEDKPASETELLLYQASRAELVSKRIKPALDRGEWVVSDRYYQSTLAFQGYGRGLSIPNIKWLSNFATGGLAPDVVIWVDTPVDVCQQRLQKRRSEGEGLDRLEEEKLSFHKKVYEGYKESSETDKESHWIVLNGLQTPEELYEELSQKFAEFEKKQ